jgi:hypothetical protein
MAKKKDNRKNMRDEMPESRRREWQEVLFLKLFYAFFISALFRKPSLQNKEAPPFFKLDGTLEFILPMCFIY